jgi:nucleotide-binding universal stress UspA family protein
VVVATDGSKEGEHAVQVARVLGARLGAGIVPVMVRFPLPAGIAPGGVTEPAVPDGVTLVEGIPAIEIVRYAELQAADLIVISRSPRWHENPYSLGDTCDAIIRRAAVPCLVIPPGQDRFTRMVAALDGSERGMAVLRGAWQMRRLSGDGLSAIFVEPGGTAPREGIAAVSSARGDVLARAMRQALPPEARVPLVPRTGDVVAQVLDGLSVAGGDILAVGVRRGGPAGVSESTGAGRRLLAAAQCAVLTIPL